MLLETERFGKISFKEDEIIYFPEGILGFEELHHYVIVKQDDSIFRFLQSVDEPSLAFVIIMPELVCYDYQVFIDDGQANNLKLKDANDAEVYCILTVPENVAEMTINLRAPVIINKKEKLGKQIVLAEGKYQTRHNVLAEMQRSAFNQKKQKEKLKKTV